LEPLAACRFRRHSGLLGSTLLQLLALSDPSLFFFMRMTTLSLQGNKMASPVSRAVLSVARSRVSAAARPAAFALAQRFYAAEAAKPAAAAPAAAAPAAAAPAAGRPPPRTNCCVLK